MTVKRGLVLGGGGVLGGTWAVGALVAMEQRYGFAAHEVDLVVGTSAGSFLGALLGLGVTVPQLRAQYAGDIVDEGPLAGYAFDSDLVTGGHRPARPKTLAPGSPQLLRESLRRPGHLPATAVLSAVLPQGARELTGIGEIVALAGGGAVWPERPQAWIVAMDYATGRRVVFGRAGAPVASLPDAVMASCAIPGWFSPVTIEGRAYVDGGTISSTSIDALTHAGLDEVYVIAPMVTAVQETVPGVIQRLARRWRQEVTKQARQEVRTLREAGVHVRMVGPGSEDLAVIGANVMVGSRQSAVLETSLQTSPAAWVQADADDD